LHRAIACFKAALLVRTKKDFPADWAATQHNLGAAYKNLPTDDRAANLKKAIACYQNALRIWTETAFPGYHQMAAGNLHKAQQLLQDIAKK